MILFIIIGCVIVLATGLFVFLFSLLGKAEMIKEDPLTTLKDAGELKKSLSGLSKDEQLAQILKVPVGAAVTTTPLTSSFELEKQIAVQEAQHQKKVAELQTELQEISNTAQAQSKEALQTIEELKQENEKLRSEQNNKDAAGSAKLIQAEQEVQAMKEEQVSLQGRLNDSQAEVAKLQDEVVAIKQKMSEEVFKSKTETELLTTENANLKKSLDESVAKAVEGFQEEMNALKLKNETLISSNQELEISNKQLNQTIAELTQKSESLEWELTKAKAQTTSYERSSENYQAQLQEALNRMVALEKEIKALKVQAQPQAPTTVEENS